MRPALSRAIFSAVFAPTLSLIAQSPWTQPSLVGSPPGRAEASLVCDSSGQRLLLFGGADGASELADSWVWTSGTWGPANLVAGPAARRGHAMADEAMVLFGGRQAGTVLGDTWQWNSGWTQVFPLVSPSARADHAMTWDPARQRVVLFGGSNGSALLGDTWEFDPATGAWSELAPANAPSPRSSAAIAFDPLRGVAVLTGGSGGSGALGDEWLWDGTDWSQAPDLALGTRSGHSLIWDADAANLVLFGGLDASGSAVGDTWVRDGAGWLRVSTTGPGARSEAAMAWFGPGSQTVFFGGTSGGQETWLYDNGALAQANVFGAGCRLGSTQAPPFLYPAPGAQPTLGQIYVLAARSIAPLSGVFGVLGFSDTSTGGFALPLDLSQFGLTGCQLLASFDRLDSLTNSGGFSVWNIGIPNDPTLVGFEFYTQLFEEGPGERALSNGLAVRIGTPAPTTFSIEELFVNDAQRDGLASAGTWSGGSLRPGTLGGDGRLGSLDLSLARQIGTNAYEINTGNFTVPASRSASGRDEIVQDGRFHFADFVVPAGVTLRFVGDFPAVVFVRGQVRIDGLVDASGADLDVFAAKDTISSVLLPGQPAGAGGPGGGFGGRGADRCDGFGVQPNFNGVNGEDIQVAAGHAYAAATAGTGGSGVDVFPPSGLSADIVVTTSFVFSGQMAAGGGGGGFAGPGGVGQVRILPPGANLAQHAGPNSVGGTSFSPLPLPVGTSSIDQFAIGGSGGGGGGSHTFLALVATPLDKWRAGAAGAGGGGALVVRAGSDLTIDAGGEVRVRGGAAAEFTSTTLAGMPSTSQGYPSPGGGGSGGSLLIQSAGAVAQNGVLDCRGGSRGRVLGVFPLAVNGETDGGDGADGFIRVEAAGSAPAAGNATPAANSAVLADADDASGARSFFYVLPPASTLLRYEVEVVLGNGTRLILSDDPNVSPQSASDPSLPVEVRFQGVDVDGGGQPVSGTETAWFAQIDPTAGVASLSDERPGAVRFDVAFRRDLDPQARVVRVAIVAR